MDPSWSFSQLRLAIPAGSLEDRQEAKQQITSFTHSLLLWGFFWPLHPFSVRSQRPALLQKRFGQYAKPANLSSQTQFLRELTEFPFHYWWVWVIKITRVNKRPDNYFHGVFKVSFSKSASQMNFKVFTGSGKLKNQMTDFSLASHSYIGVKLSCT